MVSEYKKELCDLWDQTGFYFEDESTTPSQTTLATTSTISDSVTTTVTTATDVGEIDTTTDAASSLSFIYATYTLCALVAYLVQFLQ